jgi:hypothetical protein
VLTKECISPDEDEDENEDEDEDEDEGDGPDEPLVLESLNNLKKRKRGAELQLPKYRALKEVDAALAMGGNELVHIVFSETCYQQVISRHCS